MNRRALRMLLAFVLVAAVGMAVCPRSVLADVPPLSIPFSTTAVGRGPILDISRGYSICAVTVVNGAGFTLVPQVSSDGGQTWVTAINIGGGSITTLGTQAGPPGGVTNFSINVTTAGSGTLSGTLSCSSAVPMGGAATQNVIVLNVPSPWPTSSPGGVPLIVPANASAAPYSATNPLPVTTPAPLPTTASGAAKVTNCDKTTAGQCSAVDASGNTAVAAVRTSAGLTQPYICDSFATSATITTATTTLVIAAVAAQSIRICQVNMLSLGTQSSATDKIEYGTKVTTDCDTGATAISPAAIAATNTASSLSQVAPFAAQAYPWYVLPVNTELCVVTAGSTINQVVMVWYEIGP